MDTRATPNHPKILANDDDDYDYGHDDDDFEVNQLQIKIRGARISVGGRKQE